MSKYLQDTSTIFSLTTAFLFRVRFGHALNLFICIYCPSYVRSRVRNGHGFCCILCICWCRCQQQTAKQYKFSSFLSQRFLTPFPCPNRTRNKRLLSKRISRLCFLSSRHNRSQSDSNKCPCKKQANTTYQ